MNCIPVWFWAQLTILIGIAGGVLLTIAIQPPRGAYEDLLFGFGVAGSCLLAFVATILAWWRHLAPSQKMCGDICYCIRKAFRWASGPLAITLFFMIVSFIAIAVIPYMERDMPISMYKLVTCISICIYYSTLWLKYLTSRIKMEPKVEHNIRTLEEVVVI